MPSFLFTVPLFVLRQALINLGGPIGESTLMRLVKEGESATAAGVAQVSWNLPNSLSQPIGGTIMDSNVNLPPFLTAGFYSVYSVLWLVIFRDVDLKRGKVTTASPALP
jgi:predicted MFS family arabinose efflux permease